MEQKYLNSCNLKWISMNVSNHWPVYLTIRKSSMKKLWYFSLLTKKYQVKKLLNDEFTGNPRWRQNVIDKLKLKIMVPVLVFKRCLEVYCIMFLLNSLIFYSSNIFCWQSENIEMIHSKHETKNCCSKS